MSRQTQTVAALLTPLAPGAIAVLGLAGSGVDGILSRILRRTDGRGVDLADRRPTFCRLVDEDGVVDDVVAVRIARGEQALAEINTHGGVRVAQRTLQLLERQGATLVEGDAFVARSGAIDPVEREVDRALLRASSRRLTNWLLAQRRLLPPLLARLGTLGPDELAAFQRRSRAAVRLLRGLRVALIGPPNAGKSTLANRLIGSDRVLTSPEPGTTRDWVAETAFIRGWPVTLTDTAGLRETTCPVEAEAVRRARQQAEQADLVVVVLDATAPVEEARRFLDELLQSAPTAPPQLVVRNKCDLCPAEPPASPPASVIAPVTGTGISALTGTGIDALECQIESALGLDQLDDSLPTAFLPRQLTG